MISTRGRYALRIMISLADQKENCIKSIKEIAKQQGLSEKYLEGIIRILVKANYVVSVRGRNGGYKLKRQINEYTVIDILNLTEISLAPVSCLKCEINTCDSMNTCKTLPMWKQFHEQVNYFFKCITLEDLCNGTLSDDALMQVHYKKERGF